MKKKHKLILGLILGLAAYALAWIVYDWKLMVIIALALWANNLEQGGKK